LPDALRVCAASRALELGERLLDGLDVTAARQLHAVHAARAVLAEAQGRVEESLALYEEAVERWSVFGFVLEVAQARLGVGRSLLMLQEPERARMSLEQARETFELLDAWKLVAEAEALIAEAAALAS
jgi:tetratricopeptide (TPR) repeat protein